MQFTTERQRSPPPPAAIAAEAVMGKLIAYIKSKDDRYEVVFFEDEEELEGGKCESGRAEEDDANRGKKRRGRAFSKWAIGITTSIVASYIAAVLYSGWPS